jgi:hypothetical protein
MADAYRLYLKNTTTALGDITAAQLQTLLDLFEEESADDRDYYVDEAALEYLSDRGVDPGLLAMIRPYIAPGSGIEIEWREA